MKRNYDRQIILEDGQQFRGCSFGDTTDRILEIVFNTSMTGYQEILSDPSYTDQAVVMTYPLIGNYGMADEDYETDRPDTRRLNRSIRDFGTRKCLLTGIDTPLEEGVKILRAATLPRDAVPRVSCKEMWRSKALIGTPYFGGLPPVSAVRPVGLPAPAPASTSVPGPVHAPAQPAPSSLHIVLIDCGMKKNILRSLNRRGCDVTVVPWNTSAAAIRALKPDGVLISNGPGDPTDVPQTIQTVKELLGHCPVFGICLGHQILSLAYGAKTYKLKFGHRGGNHPVKDLTTGRVEITSQNHSYAVDRDSLAGTPLAVTHVNILDGTIEGVECLRDSAFSVQYHPESSPGPQDSAYLFDRFIGWMQK